MHLLFCVHSQKKKKKQLLFRCSLPSYVSEHQRLVNKLEWNQRVNSIFQQHLIPTLATPPGKQWARFPVNTEPGNYPADDWTLRLYHPGSVTDTHKHSWPLITDAYAHTYTAYSHWIAKLCTLSNKTGSLSSHSQFLESSAWSEAFREVLTRVLGLCAFISACLF